MERDESASPVAQHGPAGTIKHTAPPRDGGILPLALRLLGAALALGLAAFALVQDRAWRADRRQLVADLTAVGLAERHPGALRRIARQDDPARAWLAAGRLLVADAMDGGWLAGLAPPELAAAQARIDQGLELARELGRQAMAERPSAWQGPMILGAATYLGWSRSQDRRLITSYQTWEQPLLQAVELAPGKPEPSRFLATAYLEVWFALAPEKRAEVKALLAAALAHPRTFDRLAGLWLEVAGSREEGFALIPDRSWAWQKTRSLLGRQRDWSGYCQAQERWREIVAPEVAERLAEADGRLRGGDLAGARDRYLEVVALAPLDRRFADPVAHALTRYPPGPVGSRWAQEFRRWLDWALPLCALGDCPLPPAALDRLAAAAAGVQPQEAALAALLSGDLARAERLERLAPTLWDEPWALYRIAKARVLADRGELDPARRSLEGVPAAWRRHPLFLLVGGRLRLDTPPGEVRRQRWLPSAWAWQGSRAALDLLPAEPGEGLVLSFGAAVPASGAAVELGWDGTSLGAFALEPGRDLRLALPITPTVHRLEIEVLAGARTLPIALELIPARTGS